MDSSASAAQVLGEEPPEEHSETFKRLLESESDFEKIVKALDEKLLARKKCIFCSSPNIRKWGRQSGLQRLRCGSCGKTYNALTGTPLARLRKKESWFSMALALREGLSIKKTAEKCKTSIPTACRWRQRFLKAL